MTHLTFTARAGITVLLAALLATALTLTGSPAHAADVVYSGVTYALIDEDDPSAGAEVTGYDGSAPRHPNLTLSDRATIDGHNVDVVSIADAALRGTGVVAVIVPASVASLGSDVFGENPSLRSVTFLGAAPSAGQGNPIAADAATDPVINFPVEYLGAFTVPTWHGFAATPQAYVGWADPFLGTDMPMTGLYVKLDQGDPNAPHGFIPSAYESMGFDITAPEGYELIGWLANGEPWEMGDSISERTLMTPVWFDTTIVRFVVITPSATEVTEGGSITMSAEGFNGNGDSVGDVTADMEFWSDVATDVVDGATITFPTASPHTIGGMYLPGELSVEPVVVEVLAAPVEEEPEEVPEEEPAPAPAPAEPVSDSVPAAPEVAPEVTVAELAETGWEEQGGLLAAASALALLGAALVVADRRRGALRQGVRA